MESPIKCNSSASRNDSLCRVCLSANDDNKCIFTLHKNLDHENYSLTDLSEKLQLYGGIQVTQHDGFPGKMCNECISKMRIAHVFRTQCQETDKILRASYKNDSNVRCWMKVDNDPERTAIEDCDELEKLEELCSNELEKLDDMYSVKSMTSPTGEMTDSQSLSEDSVEKKTLDDGKVTHDNLMTMKKICRSRELHVVKKIESDKQSQKPWRFCNEKIMEDCNEDTGGSQLTCGESKREIITRANRTKKEETPMLKKEAYKSRRFIVFKRMTSMQSLKNHKERQRQYIKKTVSSKHESDDRDAAQSTRNNDNEELRISETGSTLPHKCCKCGRSYSSIKSLETHELSHDSEKFSCDQCDQRFGRLNEFLEHAKLHELKDKLKPASCKICNKNFRKFVTMVRHLNVHKRDNPRGVYSILKDIRDRRKLKNFEMPIEDERNSEILEETFVPKIGKRTAQWQDDRDSAPDTCNDHSNIDDCPELRDNTCAFNCERCGKRYSSEESLRRHLPSHDEQIPACTACDKQIIGVEASNSHVESYDDATDKATKNSRFHLNSESQNPPDDRSAMKLINIWIKEELDSDNEGKGFPCKDCNKSYVTKKSLLKHRAKMHENVAETYCRTCGKDCTCSERMKKSDDKQPEKSKTHTCEECNKTFEKESKLEKHMRIHVRAKEQEDTNFKRFLCHICSKTFRQNTGLMFHMRTHTGYKPHVCKYCGRGFTSNSNCINHERTHTGDRPFVCHFCSAAFAKSCTLKAHITTHTGEANYHCKTCGKSFRRLKYLKEHRFTHTGEKPYVCKICGTAYSHSGSLFVHEKKCKAQHGNYQALTVPVSQNYCQNQLAIEESSVATAPIIGTLPSSHDIALIHNSLNAHDNKNYVNAVSRINAHCTSDGTIAPVHSTTINPDVPSVRSFTIIGQMFHT